MCRVGDGTVVGKPPDRMDGVCSFRSGWYCALKGEMTRQGDGTICCFDHSHLAGHGRVKLNLCHRDGFRGFWPRI